MTFFFFQAEDGIRDLTVTGVQTCALPICFQVLQTGYFLNGHGPSRLQSLPPRQPYELRAINMYEGTVRSEERRVGKECRSRWMTNPDNNNCTKCDRRSLAQSGCHSAIHAT